MSRIADRAASPALAALALLAGCTFSKPCDLHSKYGFLCVLETHRDLPQRDDRGILTGTVQIEPPPASAIVVFVYRIKRGRAEVVDAQTLHRPGPYSFAFTVPAGAYRLAAFEDRTGDLRYDAQRERAALYHDGVPVVLMPGQTVDRLYLKLRDDRPQRLEFEFTLPEHAGFRFTTPYNAKKRADRAAEKARIETALAETRGHVSGPRGAAARLGLPPTTLDAKIRSLGINKHQFKSG